MLPQPLIDRLSQQFGPAAVQDILSAFKAERLPTLRVNTLRSSDEVIMDALRAEAIQCERVKGIAHAFVVKNRSSEQLLDHNLAKSGSVYLQGLTSMLPPIILDPKPGETVLDLCAAPGSKTSQLASLMENRGTVVACEEDEIRAQKLKHTIDKQGASIVEVRKIDAGLLARDELLKDSFDRVLADVPCSAEGRINLEQPRSYRFWSQKNIIAHAKLQRRLLRAAVHCLKPGGTLVYSTCTLAPEENEQMIDWLLAEFPSLRSEVVTLPFPSRADGKGVVILPSKTYEGFFVAKLKKT